MQPPTVESPGRPAETDPSPSQLADFLRQHRAAILERWRAAISDRPASSGMSYETLIDHIPDLLDAIAETGEAHVADDRSRLDTASAERHALERLGEGLDLTEVVVELSVLRDCILHVWDRERAPGAARPEVRFLNRSVDRAISASIHRYTEARDRTLKALDRISATALETRRLKDMLQRLLEVMVETTAAIDSAAILFREGDLLVPRALVGVDGDLAGRLAIPIGEGFVGRIASEGRPRSASGDELAGDAAALLLSGSTGATYGIPLQDDGRLVGVAVVSSRRAAELSSQDRRLFQAMAARATSGVVQHMLQEAAEARAAELSAVIESIPDVVVVGDARGVSYANRPTLGLLGVDSVEELNRRFQGASGAFDIRAASGEPLPPEQRPFARALRGEEVAEDILFRNARTQVEVVLRTAAAPVRLGGRIVAAVIIGSDVTGQREATRQRQELLREARQAVADRDHVLAVVSHELRNPLNSIGLASAILKDHLAVPEIAQKGIATIDRSVKRMNRMIQDLLDVSSIQAGRLAIDPRRVEAEPLLGEVLDAFRTEAAERGLTLSYETGGELPFIRADRDRLLQALANLVGNALKITVKGGVLVRAERAAGEVVLSVADTGPGIPEDLKARIFEPYWRGNAAYQGTGLGLAITHGIVAAHGGRIWVESEVGRGTVFRLTVPVA